MRSTPRADRFRDLVYATAEIRTVQPIEQRLFPIGNGYAIVVDECLVVAEELPRGHRHDLEAKPHRLDSALVLLGGGLDVGDAGDLFGEVPVVQRRPVRHRRGSDQVHGEDERVLGPLTLRPLPASVVRRVASSVLRPLGDCGIDWLIGLGLNPFRRRRR